MEYVYYAMIAIIAFITVAVINKDVFLYKQSDKAHNSYRYFLFGIAAFFLVDTAWGFTAAFGSAIGLYVATVFYYIFMAITVTLWCVFVINYTGGASLFGKIFKSTVILLSIASVFLLIFNYYIPIFFYIDENGVYHAKTFRYVILILQVLMYITTSGVSFLTATKRSGFDKKRRVVIGLYSVEQLISLAFQIAYPLMPILTVGYLIGSCIIHALVLEDETDEYRIDLEKTNKEFKEASAIFADAGYGVWKISYNKNGRKCMFVNTKLAEVFGISDMNMTPEELYIYYHKRLSDPLEEIEKDYDEMTEGQVRSRLLTWRHDKKGIIYLRAGGTVHAIDDKAFIISGYCGDVTDQKNEEDILNAKLATALVEANSSNNAKTAFLFNMSHDIRTPMNSIIGYTRMMKNNIDDKEKLADYIYKIDSSSRFLLDLINNVLEMARIESGKAEINETLWDTREFEEDLISVFAGDIKAKNLEFTKKIDIKHNLIFCDTTKIREIYLNIISNAIKYTPDGGTISVELNELENSEPGYATFISTVTDTGIGMSKEFLPHLFEEFTREKNTTESKIIGTGLGMPIVKALVEMLNGTIEVESELGVGTKFTITIPHKIATDTEVNQIIETKKSIENITLEGKRVLVVEDNELNVEIVKAILEDNGMIVETAENGKAAVDRLSAKRRKSFDIVLMDVQMPVMDGYEATKQIRAFDSEISIIPIIAMTANAFDEDKNKSIESGMNDHIAKPISVDVLINTIKKHL